MYLEIKKNRDDLDIYFRVSGMVSTAVGTLCKIMGQSGGRRATRRPAGGIKTRRRWVAANLSDGFISVIGICNEEQDWPAAPDSIAVCEPQRKASGPYGLSVGYGQAACLLSAEREGIGAVLRSVLVERRCYAPQRSRESALRCVLRRHYYAPQGAV